MKLSVDLMMSILQISMYFSGVPFFLRELNMIIAKISKEEIHEKIEQNFESRKKYLELCLRYNEYDKAENNLGVSLKKIYKTEEIFRDRKFSKILENEKLTFVSYCSKKSIFSIKSVPYILNTLKKSIKDLSLGKEFEKISTNFLINFIAKYPTSPLNFNGNRIIAGLLFFQIKLFYGIGVDFPSLILLSEE